MGVHTINNMETLVKKLKQSHVAKSEIISIICHLCDGGYENQEQVILNGISKWSCKQSMNFQFRNFPFLTTIMGFTFSLYNVDICHHTPHM